MARKLCDNRGAMTGAAESGMDGPSMRRHVASALGSAVGAAGAASGSWTNGIGSIGPSRR